MPVGMGFTGLQEPLEAWLALQGSFQETGDMSGCGFLASLLWAKKESYASSNVVYC